MELKELKTLALEENIPIMQDEGLAFMISQLDECRATSLLEIGSAIGYSAITMATSLPQLKIDTIERDDSRYQEAKKHIEDFKLSDRISIHKADALEFNEEALKFSPYDCLFIDGAKAQYQKFFEKYIGYVKEDGFVIVDNLDFHGMIFDIENIHNRNTRALVRKIKRFKEWILNNQDYESHYFAIGDGIVLIRKRGNHETHVSFE